MGQTEATRQGDWILPPSISAAGSSNACAFAIGPVAQVVDLTSIPSPPGLQDAPQNARDRGPIGHFVCVQAQTVDGFVIFGPSVSSLTTGQVSGALVGGGGSGYVTAPTVAVTAGGGSGAAGTFTFTGGSNVIASVTMTAAGSGYASAPTVTVTGGSLGTGATFVASLFSSVGSLFVGTAGTGYGSAPTVAIIGGGGSGAAGTAVLSGTTVASITLTAAGSGYAYAPTVSLSGGGGNGAAATASVFTSVSGVAVTAGGSLYPAAAAPSFTAGGGSGATATAQIDTSIGGGVLKSITITGAGSGYTSPPTLTLSGGSNVGAAGYVGAVFVGTTPSPSYLNTIGAGGAVVMNPSTTAWIPAGHTATFKLPVGSPEPPWGANSNWRCLGFVCAVATGGSGALRVWQGSA